MSTFLAFCWKSPDHDRLSKKRNLVFKQYQNQNYLNDFLWGPSCFIKSLYIITKNESIHFCNNHHFSIWTKMLNLIRSKIEKVPRGIRGEKSSKDMASYIIHNFCQLWINDVVWWGFDRKCHRYLLVLLWMFPLFWRTDWKCIKYDVLGK